MMSLATCCYLASMLLGQNVLSFLLLPSLFAAWYACNLQCTACPQIFLSFQFLGKFMVTH